MVIIHTLFAVATSLIGLTGAAPNLTHENPRFYIRIEDPGSNLNLTNYYLQTYHTGAGMADIVFVNDQSGKGSKLYLNDTSLLVDTGGEYPFGLIASTADVNYARWEPTSIEAGYGSDNWVFNGTQYLTLRDTDFGSWLVCQWFHGKNLPQLFTGIDTFDVIEEGSRDVADPPSSCANVKLVPEYINY